MMAKLKNVTSSELGECAAYFDSGLDQLFDITNRIEKGYCDELTDIFGAVRALNNVVRAAADLNTHLMIRAEMQRQRAEIASLAMTSNERSVAVSSNERKP
jgi:hypothetical protein